MKWLNSVGGLLLVAAVAFGAGYFVAEEKAPDPLTQVEGLGNITVGMPSGVDFATFWSAWNTINDKYVPTIGTSTDPITTEEKLWGAINGLTNSLGDPYTSFFPPEQLKIFEADISGNFEGVGMEVALRNGYITVVAPLPNTPAERSGVKSGDVVIAIDGKNSVGMTIEEGVRLIRGPRGTDVVLTVLREGEDGELDITITRDVIDIPTINTAAVKKKAPAESPGGTNEDGTPVATVEKEDIDASDPALRDDGIYVIELYNFGATSPELFRQAMVNFELSGADKLILDLRGNPGGFLEAAVDIASYFLPKGTLVVSERVGAAHEEREHRALGHTLTFVPEIVILVDGGSASASEILAGALSQHGVATLVGTQTFGKGSVQELVPISDDASIKVTVARWLTPDGTSLSEVGLTPDVEVKLDEEAYIAGVDTQLEKAVEILTANE